MMTFGDGVSDVDLSGSSRSTASHGKLATLTAVRPPARFGHVELDGDRVAEFSEKPQTGEGWINGGFFVLEREVLDYIDGDDDVLPARAARAPAARRSADGLPARLVLAVHGHASRQDPPPATVGPGQAPWKVWS